MLKITIPRSEQWDSVNNQFLYFDEETITLEHSLISVSKWESKWKKPFLDKNAKSHGEMIDYVRCMTITPNVDPAVYNGITDNEVQQVVDYIDDPMTATWFPEYKGRRNSEIITAEVIYYWMIAMGIPFECQKWHLNKLLTLIRVCSAKSDGGKKLGRNEIMQQNAALNKARRIRANSKG